MDKTIITCAPTGNGDTPRLNRAVQVTPEQIANKALAACEAGASTAYIHVRDPKTRAFSTDRSLYREVIARFRESGYPILTNLSAGRGAGFYSVRVGLEDKIYLGKRELAPGNAAPVRRSINKSIGGEVATPDEARSILRLEPQ
jgi:uncharacterized protein (DUF849 family)